MLDLLKAYWAVYFTYRGYEPQPVTSQGLRTWLDQFEARDRGGLLALLRHVHYISEGEMRRSLADSARTLLAKLTSDGVPSDHVIFMSIAEAASSSHLHLSQLRNDARLEPLECTFLDARDIPGISNHTRRIGEGAIIYVDDFLGSGHQFLDAREVVAPYALGSFSEFFLVYCACEEGYSAVQSSGVEVIASVIHERSRRPLHPLSSLLRAETKERLLKLSADCGMGVGLGYESMATMLVTYHNAPDTTPSLLRGSPGQSPIAGLFPRTNDF